MSNAQIALMTHDKPTDEEYFVLGWLSRPDEDGHRMTGRQEFTSREKAVEFMSRRIPTGSVFVSLHGKKVTVADLTDETSALLKAASIA